MNFLNFYFDKRLAPMPLGALNCLRRAWGLPLLGLTRES